LVSPHRTKRPWQGKIESLQDEGSKQYDPGCYLCPGNKRADGAINPLYDSTYVFTNDFSALLKDTPEGIYQQDNLLKAKSESGICRVITFSPHHDLALPELTKEEIKNVIDVWCVEFEKLAANAVIKSIQIFENKGEMMGCSNPHPHGQIWAQTSLPQEIIKETGQQQLYFSDHKKSLLSDYIELEAKLKERVVEENDYFIVLVPFWAVWPYETILISKRHVQNILMFTEEEKYGYADMLKKLTTRYDNLFQISFPYSAGMHQAAVNDGDHPEWH